MMILLWLLERWAKMDKKNRAVFCIISGETIDSGARVMGSGNTLVKILATQMKNDNNIKALVKLALKLSERQ